MHETKRTAKDRQYANGGLKMDIYEKLTMLEEDVKDYGISPLSFVVLNCAR